MPSLGSIVITALALFSALANSQREQAPITGVASHQELKMPGDNPFYYCTNPLSNSLQIASLNLGPPDQAKWHPHTKISFQIDAHNQQIIEPGATLDWTLMALLPHNNTWIIRRHVPDDDLCSALRSVFSSSSSNDTTTPICPIRSGVATETRTLTIPPDGVLPAGDYFLAIDGPTKFRERITCMSARFSLPGLEKQYL